MAGPRAAAAATALFVPLHHYRTGAAPLSIAQDVVPACFSSVLRPVFRLGERGARGRMWYLVLVGAVGRVWVKLCHFWRLGAGSAWGETDDSCRFWQSWC